MNIDKDKLSPMMRKYIETKEEYPDCILFYRLGDFYEMFFDDALLASKVLDIALTGKSCGLEERAPMCGVPYHSANSYLMKLIEAGYKVAIGEQVEDPSTAKGLVKREVVKIVTPGTLIDEDSLEKINNNYLMVIYCDTTEASIAYADVSTGELNVTKVDFKKIKDEVAKISPAEILTNNHELLKELKPLSEIANIYLNESFDDTLFNSSILYEKFSKEYLEKKGITNNDLFKNSVSILLNYVTNTQMSDSNNFNEITIYNASDYMLLDLFTRVNLELTKTIRGSKRKGSLLQVLDMTSTPMGARMLKKFIEQPLTNKEKIEYRLEITEKIMESYLLRDELKTYLSSIFDLERICAKIAYDNVSPKDLINLKNSISVIPNIINTLESSEKKILTDIASSIDPLDDIYKLLSDTIMDNPSLNIKDGNVIKSEYSEEVMELRDISRNGAYVIKDIELREKEKTGAKTLKIGYNKVFGYYIEITKSALFQANLDDTYIRKQTLVNAERFITPELKEIEDKIINAEEKIKKIEYDIFKEIRLKVYDNIERIQRVASVLSELDVYVSNALVASRYEYVRPSINNDGKLKIEDGRHPVIEQIIGKENFISNTTNIDTDNIINIITGPNMSGKSTYMRQTALIALMAHIGIFVPAKSASIPILDRIFTRVGASDDLSQGQSTFMVEMNEVSQILKNATCNSLIILDEVGRGTSTYDGISLAWSIVEYIHDNISAKTLFATHYHELTELENKYKNIKNYSVDVQEDGDNIVFLRKIVPSAADRSYGIYVAKLAKLPVKVLNRADEILSELEKNHIYNASGISSSDKSSSEISNKKNICNNNNAIDKTEICNNNNAIDKTEICKNINQHIDQLNFLDKCEEGKFDKIIDMIKTVDLMNSTPMQSMNILYNLQKEIKELE